MGLQYFMWSTQKIFLIYWHIAGIQDLAKLERVELFVAYENICYMYSGIHIPCPGVFLA